MIKIGMRTIKSAVAVGICIFTLGLVGFNKPFFACMTAVYAMEVDINTSLKAGVYRFLGTFAGAIVGTLFALLSSYIPIEILLVKAVFTSVGIVLLIHTLNLLKLKDSVFIGCIVFLALMLSVEGPLRYKYAITRTLLTGYGAIVALVVNRVVYPNWMDKIESLV